jgi:release factor glutamine methyltransferase
VLEWVTEDLKARHFESPRLDAELLLAHVLKLDRVGLIIDRDRPLEPSELERYRALVKRRRAFEPIAYILGQREFYGMWIAVDPRALVPRPDTETLVEVALREAERISVQGRLLDLCTGSGCVALAFAQRRSDWRAIGIDISEAAVELARSNAEQLGLASTAQFLTGDLAAPIGPTERFELIVGNPPYIPSGEIPKLDATVRDFEPHLALDGGVDGLDVARRIISDAPARLAAGALLALEVGEGQADAVEDLMREAGLEGIERHRDYGGRERVVSGRRS